MQNFKERKKVYRVISWILTVVMVVATLNLGGIPASKVFAVEYDLAIDFTAQGYAEDEDVSVASSDSGDTGVFFTNAVYKTDTLDIPAVRCYADSYVIVETFNGQHMEKIVLNTVSGDDGNEISADVGTFDGNTWTGDADQVTFHIGGSNGHRRLQGVAITFKDDPITLTAQNTKLLADKFTYTGATIEPVVQYKASAEEEAVTLTKGTDYDVVQGGKDSATDVSTDVYEFTISGKGAYSGNVTLDWVINPADVSGDKAMLDATKFFYTGEAITPVVQYQAIEGANAVTLTKGTDYDVQGGTDSATDMDAYSFTIKGKGNYTGEKTFEWKIVPEKPVAIEGLEYDGTAQELIIPADSGDTYEYRYRVGDNGRFSTTVPTRTNAGTYVVNYRYYTRESATSTNWDEDRSKRGNFTVEIAKFPVIVSPKADQSKTYGMSDPDFTYTVAPNGENKVLPEKDFENGMFKNGSLTHTGGEAVGEHDFSITNLASSNSNYSVTMEENAPKFTITKKSLKDKDIVAVNYDEDGEPIDTDGDGKFEYEYTGSVIEPDVVLYYTDREVNASGGNITNKFDPSRNKSARRNSAFRITEADYAISGTTTGKEVSDEDDPYEISYRGQGNYTDTAIVEWEITEGELDCEFIAYEGTYDGEEYEAIVDREFFVDGEETDKFDYLFTAEYILLDYDEYEEYVATGATDEDIWKAEADKASKEVPLVKDAGRYAVVYKVHVPGFKDYIDVNVSTIDKAPVELTADEITKVYDNDESTDPELTFEVDKSSIVEGDEIEGIEISREEGQDAGTYEISFNTDKLNEKYPNYDFYVGDDSGSFTISKRPVTVSAPTLEKTYSDPVPEDYMPVIQPAGEVEGEGLIEGDILEPRLRAVDKRGNTVTVGRKTNAGIYDLTVRKRAGNPNYTVVVDEDNCGTLTVRPKDIEEFSEDDGSIKILFTGHEDKLSPVFSYTGETVEPKIMLTDFVDDYNYMTVGEEVPGGTEKYDYRIYGEKKAQDIGVYYVEIEGANNYCGSIFLSWAILPFDYETEAVYNGKFQAPGFVDGVEPNPDLFEIKYLNSETKEFDLDQIPTFKDVKYDEKGNIEPYQIRYQITLNPDEFGTDEEGKPITFDNGYTFFTIKPYPLALDLSELSVTKEYDGKCEISLDDPETGYAFSNYPTGVGEEKVNVKKLVGTLADPDSNHALGLSDYDKRNVKLTTAQLGDVVIEAANDETIVDNYEVIFDEQANNACAIVNAKVIKGIDELEPLEAREYDGTDDASYMVEPTCDTGIEGQEIKLNVTSARYEEVVIEGDEYEVIDGKDVYLDEEGNPAPHDVSVFMLPEAANEETKLGNYASEFVIDMGEEFPPLVMTTYLDEYNEGLPMKAETTGIIVPRELVVTIDDIEKTYDGKAISSSDVTFDMFGYQEIEDDTAAYIDENLDKLFKFEFSAEPKNVGTYKISCTGIDEEFEEILTNDSNYLLCAIMDSEVKIAPKAVTVKALDATKVEGEADPTFKYTVDGLADGETLKNIKVTRKAGDAAGTYDIYITCDADPNYNITFTGAKLTITKKAADYKNEWVDGQWYDAEGKTDYTPKGSWKQNATGWWFEDESGWYPVQCWQKIDGLWYYFGVSGYMAASEWIDGWWCDADGACRYEYQASWKQDSTGWWYGDASGWYAVSSWQKIDNIWYYFGADGYLVTNQYVDGYWVNADGAWAE